jgi:hypothetical protein
MRKDSFLLRFVPALITLALLIATGCGSESQKPKPGTESSDKTLEEEKPAEPTFVTGRSAFQKLYVSARTWAPDAQPVRLESRPHKLDPHDGRAGIWTATFVSASRQNLRSYIWSGITADNAPEPGVSPGSMDVYSPSNASTRPFDLTFLKVDSGRAFVVAQKKGGAALMKKDPEQPIKYMLFWDPQKARLLWRVVYGSSESNSKLRILVNASDGEFVAVEK